ncbi:MAG: hypothetical protein IJU76_12220 [Desulfovibrionaceae bacterium]|nr:hypothetical protein [Desulfovibrionaceae bacterium]
MHIRVLPVVSGTDLTHFIDLPWSLYSQTSHWVPSIRSEDRKLLQPGLHPFWEHAERKLFLVRRGERWIGRIAAIIDHAYNAYAGTRCGYFGFFECAEDREAAHALLHAAADWLTSRGIEYIRGPFNPSSNYTCGMLVDGFQEKPSLMMPWNPPYYPLLLESWRAYKEQDLFCYRIRKDTCAPKPAVLAAVRASLDQGLFTCRTASKATLADDIRTMLSLYRSSWANNLFFTPLSAVEENTLVHELLPIVDTDFFVLFFHGEDAAGGMVALPNLTPLLKKMNGSVGPALPWQYLTSRKAFQRNYRIMLFGILERYRLFGLPALLFNYMIEAAKARPDLEWVEGSWVLEDNAPICSLIEDFSGEITMRYRIYRKELC